MAATMAEPLAALFTSTSRQQEFTPIAWALRFVDDLLCDARAVLSLKSGHNGQDIDSGPCTGRGHCPSVLLRRRHDGAAPIARDGRNDGTAPDCGRAKACQHDLIPSLGAAYHVWQMASGLGVGNPQGGLQRWS